MRTRYNLRLLSGLVALGTILPTAAHADDVHAEGSDNSITVTGTTRTQIQSPGRPDTGTPRTGGADGDGAATASADGADGSATELCYLGELGLRKMHALSCLFAPAAPDPGGGAGGEPPTTVTITATDTAALLVDGSGLHRQPPGPQALITLDVIAYTSPDTRTITTTVANTPRHRHRHPHRLRLRLGRRHHHDHHRPRSPLPPPHHHPPLPAHRHRRHHHPDHHLDRHPHPRRRHPPTRPGHHHHHRDHPALRHRAHHHLPHRRRRRSPRTLTRHIRQRKAAAWSALNRAVGR